MNYKQNILICEKQFMHKSFLKFQRVSVVLNLNAAAFKQCFTIIDLSLRCDIKP